MSRVKSKLNKTLVLDIISFVARFYMAFVWFKAGLHKVNTYMDTSQSITAYKIFTPEFSGYLATIIGPLEIAGGVLLLLGIFLKQSSKVATIVLILFIIGMGQAWARGLNIECGCFGVQPSSNPTAAHFATSIARDFLFVFLTVWTIYRPFKKWAIHA